MKNLFLLTLIGLSLTGLAVVQFRFLTSGLQLEKARLDRQVEAALARVDRQLAEEAPLRTALLGLHETELRAPGQAQPAHLWTLLRDQIDGALAMEGADIDYDFALRSAYFGWDLLWSEGYGAGEGDLHYTRILHEKPGGSAPSGLVLHLQADNIIPYLLGKLSDLVALSVLFTLLLIACLIWLYRTLHQLRRLDAVKNDFINNLTHELKTPVFSTALLLRLLRESIGKGRAAKSEEYIGLMEKENARLRTHIEKVLELASLRSGRYELQLQSTPVHPLLEELAEQWRPTVENRLGKLTMELRAAHDLVIADPDHLRNALGNLLDNAVKYSDGPPRIRLTTRNDGGRLRITVADRGIGLPATDRRKVFRKFYRVSTGDRHPVKGFGLGLSYVREVVRRMGGRIGLESRPGAGTVVDVFFSIVNKGKRREKREQLNSARLRPRLRRVKN